MSDNPRYPRTNLARPRAPRPNARAEWLAPEERADPFTTLPQRAYSDNYDEYDGYGDYDQYSGPSEFEGTPAMPLLTLPTVPSLPKAPRPPSPAPSTASRRDVRGQASPNSYPRHNPPLPARSWDRWDNEDDQDIEDAPSYPEDDGYRDQWNTPPTRRPARSREHSAARPLALVRSRLPNPSLLLQRPASRRGIHHETPPVEPHLIPGLPAVLSVPNLASHRPMRALARPRVATRAIIESARSPWSATRVLFALLALSTALWLSLSAAGEPNQPLMANYQTRADSYDARAITALVQPETQGMRPDLYDSNAQFNDWWDAACSAAVLSEVLTAWSVPHATIGKVIDVMQPDISLNGGLLTPHGFQRGAEAFGYRADIDWHLTYKQLLYITNVLGLPVIVNVRISYGYYHFFSGGHFLVMTGGDAQGLKIVDSSEYYIHYLPLDTFNSMFTGMTAVIVPKDYQYSVPSI